MGRIRGEILKLKRTPIPYLIGILPIVYGLILFFYLRLRGNLEEIDYYEAFFLPWTGFVLPVLSGIVPGFSVRVEEQGGDFIGFLGGKDSRREKYLGKFTVGFLGVSLASLVGGGVFTILSSQLKGFSPEPYLGGILLVIVSSLPVFFIHYGLGMFFGLGGALGASVVGVLTGAIIGGTGIGDVIWPVVPWALPVRLSLVPDVFSFYPGREDLAFQVLSTGFLAFGIQTILFAGAGLFFFSRWEGRKS